MTNDVTLCDNFVTILTCTDYRCVMAISQILYVQYCFWDMFVSGLKTKVFCRKNKMLKTHNAKMGAECADRLAKNAAKAPKFIGPICLP